MSVRDLAEIAKVSPATVTRLERGDDLRPRTVAAIKAALETRDIEFIDEHGDARRRPAPVSIHWLRASGGATANTPLFQSD